jgi:hypothetical protein
MRRFSIISDSFALLLESYHFMEYIYTSLWTHRVAEEMWRRGSKGSTMVVVSGQPEGKHDLTLMSCDLLSCRSLFMPILVL